jgi:hypothetical protein
MEGDDATDEGKGSSCGRVSLNGPYLQSMNVSLSIFGVILIP